MQEDETKSVNCPVCHRAFVGTTKEQLTDDHVFLVPVGKGETNNRYTDFHPHRLEVEEPI